jgi:hypothetical protein
MYLGALFCILVAMVEDEVKAVSPAMATGTKKNEFGEEAIQC